MLALAFALALDLVRPVDVIEEWSIVSQTPLLELVTTRAVYRRAEGSLALLPAAVQGGAQPDAFAPGTAAPLEVRAGAQGWYVVLPPDVHPAARIVARLVRPVPSRLFRVAWPPATEASTVPRRRVATIPRMWLRGEPSGWSCPEAAADETIACVTTARTPTPLLRRIAAPTAPRTALVLAWVAVALAAAAAIALGRSSDRSRRAVGAGAGIAAGLTASLAWVGAHAMNWPAAIALGGVLGAWIGAHAGTSRARARVGSIALVCVPLVAVSDGRPRDVFAAGAITLLALGLARR